MTKNKLYFIVGFAHSGSSITARILNSIPNSVNVGEISLYDRYYTRGDACSCGKIIKDCDFWEQIDIQSRKAMFISFKDLIYSKRLKQKVAYNTEVYRKIFEYCQSLHRTETYTIIDNSKHPLRGFLLTRALEKDCDTKVFFTERAPQDMIKSFKKRKGIKLKGKLSRNIWLFYPYFIRYKLTKFIFKILYRLYNIQYETVKQKEISMFLNRYQNELNIDQVTEERYEIKDHFNHSIGGSGSSHDSLLKITR